jgi:hypothetical protein
LSGAFYDKDDHSIVDYGHAASGQQRRSIIALVERYYRALVTNDGSVACSLIDPILAGGLPPPPGTSSTQSAGSGSSSSGEGTCAANLTAMLKQLPAKVARELVGTKVIAIRVNGGRGLALVRPRNSEARYLQLQREAGGWKIQTLFAGTML